MKAIKTIEAIEKYKWPYNRNKVCELTLTYKCNAHCVFCYSSPEMEEWKNKNSLSLKTAISYMLSSYKNGARILQIIGGEPTIYPEFIEIIKYAKKIGYPVIQIVTNGQRLSDKKFAKKAFNEGLNSITFSLHADNAHLHDKVVGLDGAFENLIKALEFAIENKIHITIGTAITSFNYKILPSLLKLLYDEYQIESYHLVYTHFIGGAVKNSKDIKVKATQTTPYIREALSYLTNKRVMPIGPVLNNYQPCLLPGFEHLISDWQYPYNDDDLFLPEKVYKDEMYTMITNDLRMKGENCKNCIYSKICAGFEKEYFKIYKDKEFKPLKSISKPFPLSVFYKR